MKAQPGIEGDRLWLYAVLPPVILNLGSFCIFGIYYGLAAQRPELVAGIGEGQLFFAVYVFIFSVEWAFGLSLVVTLKRRGIRLLDLIAPQDDPWRLNWLPAALVFLAFNGIFAVYMSVLWATGMLQPFEGASVWQGIFLLGLVPITAGFWEELIWRGYIITRLEARGRKRWAAILLSAASFALIHGVVLPDRLLVTFLIGVVTGLYFTRERNLIPLMVTHTVVDVWSFGLYVFLA